MKNAPDGSVFLCNYKKLLDGASPNLFVQDDAKQSFEDDCFAVQSLLAEYDVAVRDELVAELVVSLVDFVVRERTVHSLVSEAVNHVLLACFNLFAFVDALESNLREVLRVESLDAGEHVFVSHRLCNFNRDVAGRRHLAHSHMVGRSHGRRSSRG